MIRSLSALAVITTIAGFVVACDRNDASTTTTTGALYDAAVVAPLGVQVDNGTVAAPLNSQPQQLNVNGADPTGPNGARYGTPGAPLPRAVSPGSPASGYGSSAQGANPGTASAPDSMNAPTMNANSMNNNGAMNGNGAMNNVPGGNNVGAVNNGTSAGSMNGTRPMNQLGSSASPYRNSNGATDAPNAPRQVSPNAVP